MKIIKVMAKSRKLLRGLNERMKKHIIAFEVKSQSFLEKEGIIEYSVSNNFAELFKEKLEDSIAASVIFNAKSDIYSDVLTNVCGKSMYGFLLCRALVFSDFCLEKNVLKSSISGFYEYNLDGIRSFLLKDEEKEWSEIAAATKKCDVMLQSGNEFKKLLRCITSNIDCKRECLYILDAGRAYLTDCEFKPIRYSFSDFEKGLDEEEKILAAIIENMPKKLAIYSENTSKKLDEALKLLF